MNLDNFKTALENIGNLNFVLPNETLVPPHFHITEVAKTSKQCIDCGGIYRETEKITFQLWYADDFNHRLEPQKLLAIIEMAEEKMKLQNVEIEFEYQAETICSFGVEFTNGLFRLLPTFTDCLAKDSCGIPEKKPKVTTGNLRVKEVKCNPNSGCC